LRARVPAVLADATTPGNSDLTYPTSIEIGLRHCLTDRL
jgi:hypothetical protein